MDDIQILSDLPAALREKEKEIEKQRAELRANLNRIESILLQMGSQAPADVPTEDKALIITAWGLRDQIMQVITQDKEIYVDCLADASAAEENSGDTKCQIKS